MISQSAAVIAHILNNAIVDGDRGIARAIKSHETNILEQAQCDTWFAEYCRMDAFPELAVYQSAFWQMVSDAIQREIDARNRPAPQFAGSRYADFKATNRVEDIAAQYTRLIPAGPNKFKGCCPMHSERTPSFIVNTDTQKWRCFGACATGGDVIDLVQRLGIWEARQ